MSDQIIEVYSDEYKARFLKHLHDVYGLDEDMATCEFEGVLTWWDNGDASIPEWDADESMSYWGP